jgi:hypothetical protein
MEQHVFYIVINYGGHSFKSIVILNTNEVNSQQKHLF